MRPGDSKVGEEGRDRFGRHRGAPVSVDRVRGGAVASDRVVDEVAGHDGVLGRAHDVRRGVSGVDVDQCVEVEPDAFARPSPLSDILGPNLGGAGGD